jgi:hypothetical protein
VVLDRMLVVSVVILNEPKPGCYQSQDVPKDSEHIIAGVEFLSNCQCQC